MSDISSGADLAATMDMSAFDSASSIPDAGVPDVQEDTSSDSALEADLTAAETPETLESQPEDPNAEPVATAPPVDPELPEGVEKGKNAAGKDGVWATKNRWDNIYQDHVKVRELSEMIGEPLSKEALDVRNRAFLGQEKLYTDLLSGNPESQGKLVNHLFDEAARAVAEGGVGANPMVPFTQTLYSTLKNRDPDAYAALRTQSAQDLVSEMYEEAAATGNRNLWLSAGHIAKELGIPFKPEVEMAQRSQQAADPMAALRAENEALRAHQQGQQQSQSEAYFNNWKAGTTKNVMAAFQEEISKAIPQDVSRSWEAFPDQFKANVIAPLHKAVMQALNKDAAFNERIGLLTSQARQSPSAQRREQIAGQIRQAHVNRASLAADTLKRDILTSAAKLLAQQNQQTHQRRQSAQDQRSPRGTGTTPQKSLILGISGSRANGTTPIAPTGNFSN